MTPNQLAAKLAGTDHAERIGKAFVRPYLRRNFTRDGALRGTSWDLSDSQIAEVTAAWKAKQKGSAFDTSAYRKTLRVRKPKETTIESVA